MTPPAAPAPAAGRARRPWRAGACLAAGALLAGGAALARRPDPDVAWTRVRVEGQAGRVHPGLRLAPRDGPRRGTALLAHGVTASKETLAALAEALAREGFECLALDLPGHGASDVPLRDAGAMDDALVAGARALSGAPAAGAPAVDVLVGHSMGAFVGQAALRAGRLRARAFVGLGATLAGDPPAARALLITGRWDPLATPARVAASARGRAAGVLVVAADHVTEPWAPEARRAVVAEALAAVGAAAVRADLGAGAGLRALGAALALAALPLLALGLPRLQAAGPGAALALGAAGGAAVLGVAVAALDGAWVGLAPRPRHALALAPLVAAALGVSWLAAALAGRVRPGLGPAAPAAGHAALAIVVLALGAAGAAGGATFAALLATLFAAVLTLGLAAAAWAARAAGRPAAAHAAWAVVVAYWPALLAGLAL